jgi:hypothetical protein
MEKNDGIGCYIYDVSQAWSSMNPVMLVRSLKKHLPDLEQDDLHHFPNEVISKSEILDTVYATRSSENVNKDNVEDGYKVMHVNWASSTIDTNTVNAAVKQKGEEEVGEDENEEGEGSERVSHSMALQCVDSFLDYMGQRGFEYSALQLPGKFTLS